MTFTSVPGADGEHITYCRICEALCGMVADVKDGRIVKIRPDRDNPHSRGHICVKGPALAEVGLFFAWKPLRYKGIRSSSR